MYIGIDFGTSYSKAALWDDEMRQAEFLLPRGMYGIPSAFYYDSDSGVLIGKDAEDEGLGIQAKNLKIEVKMDLANDFTADGRTFTSKEIVSEIYKYVLNVAKNEASKKGYGSNVQGAVISVPAAFDQQQITLIKSAAEDAGIKVTAVIPEPVAAALAYYKMYNKHYSDTALIFDLGGGTCDIALVTHDSSSESEYRVIDKHMIECGGKDWDKVLTNYLLKEYEQKSGKKLSNNPGYMEKIRRKAVETKEALAIPDKDDYTARVEIDGRILKKEISLSLFDEITGSLLKKAIQALKEVYDRNSSQYDIDDIICVGGSSNMKQVLREIRLEFPDCNVDLIVPEAAVVYGDAIYADKIKGRRSETTAKNFLQDIAAFSYGIRCFKDYDADPNYEYVQNLTTAGSPLPCSNEHGFWTTRANMYSCSFPIYESKKSTDTYELYEGKNIGTMELILPPNSPKNYELKATIKVNINGILEARATDGKGHSIQTRIDLNSLKR